MSDLSAIQALARRCAAKGLKLHDARGLFDALYLADALYLEEGAKLRAADRAGIGYSRFNKMQRDRAAKLERMEKQ